MITGVAHFCIPVSDLERSKRFYTEIVGLKFLGGFAGPGYVFLDAGGVCVILVKKPAATIPPPELDHGGVHHSFMVDAASYDATLKHLRANNVEIFFEEDRQDGFILGPRAYFRDPDGSTLEIINRTHYAADAGGKPKQ